MAKLKILIFILSLSVLVVGCSSQQKTNSTNISETSDSKEKITISSVSDNYINLAEYFPDKSIIKTYDVYFNKTEKPDRKTIETITVGKNKTKVDVKSENFNRESNLPFRIMGYYILSNKAIVEYNDYNHKNIILLYYEPYENFSDTNDAIKYMLKERATVITPAGKFQNCAIVEHKNRYSITRSFYAPRVGVVYTEGSIGGQDFFKVEELINIKYQ